MSFQDLLKFATQEAVKKIDEPKSERHRKREEKKSEQEPLSHWAFGIIPFALSVFKRQRKNERHK
ncbi:YqzE family protein [Shouchella sp. JSM 1781072]|uniref:YqzE family protein n=1 Tax=Bacillaceae TaxID=186817 RepID=UPI000C079DB7|nr:MULTISPECIES: YqzE family protein [Bacillaceae]UTR04978.1 YqzE family protein [Alkalihalobacillus sp. LMS6]